MKSKQYKLSLSIIFLILLSIFGIFASAEIIILNLNRADYSAGESAKVFGYLFDNSFNGLNNTAYSVYVDGSLEAYNVTDSEGFYEYFITNVSTGDHNVTVNTSSSSQILTFSVVAASSFPSYQIIASSLSIPLSSSSLNFTVKKYLGETLSDDTYSYIIYYENGTLFNSSTGVSNVVEVVSLPQEVGMYSIVVDDEKIFSVSVEQFRLKFKILDSAGGYENVFKPDGVAYFEVEGFSNGQKLSNATVTAKVTDKTGSTKTVTFTETSGLYKGNTNVTQTTAIQLRAGDYEVEFIMEDSSGNEQNVKGFFTVFGLSVNLELVDKKPYKAGETAEFDVIVKNLANGNLVFHNDTTYFLELEHKGKLYDSSTVTSSENSDTTKTSSLSFVIPVVLEDGDYFLELEAFSSGKIGDGTEFFELMNTEVFVELTDNYGDLRNSLKPGELAKIGVESNTNMSFVSVEIENQAGTTQTTTNSTPNATTSSLSFNAPSTQGSYVVKIEVITNSGSEIKRQKWFNVKNYESFLDVKNLNNNFQFVQASEDEFLAEINVLDISTGGAKDLTDFTIKFDKIVNDDTSTQTTNFQSTKNTTYSDDSAGKVSYNIVPPSFSNGIYRLDYTLIDTLGDSFKGSGWFGISSFDIEVATYDENGQQKELFAAGSSINVTVSLSSALNGTATIHREFFDSVSFTITNGVGSILLTSAQSQLPSQSGFYGFGVEFVSDSGDSGFGDGFFEVRNLNFRSIASRSNGEFGVSDNIVADIVIEKSGDLVNETNVTLSRLFRWDGLEVDATGSASLTDSLGRTTMTINPSDNLEPGEYFADLKATKDGGSVFEGFGFEIVEDKVIITINDADNEFLSTDNIEINVKLTYQNDTPKSNVTINLSSLLNFNTWASLSSTKQATTSSNGVATITLSASNYNAGRYAPVVKVPGISNEIVGFGNGEFEIKSFTSTTEFQSGTDSFSIGENILIDVNVSGTATITAVVTDLDGSDQSTQYSYSSGVLTLNNELSSGEYFVTVTITQSSNTVTKTLWFEVISPWAYFEQLPNPTYDENGVINLSYEVFTFSTQGWQLANATLNITSIENLWTGNETTVGQLFNGTEQGSYLFNISPYSLSRGDYLLNLKITTNADYDESVYFRVDKDISINIQPTVNGNNVTINFTTTGLSSPVYYLEGYNNYDDWEYTANGSQVASGQNVEFDITNLENGFYQTDIRIEDGSEIYYWDAFFEVRVKEVTINAPSLANVNDVVQFNISSSTSTTFWIIDPFTQSVKKQVDIGPGTEVNNVTFQFDYPGFFFYSFGDTKWDSFPNAEEIDINEPGFDVEWPFEENRYILTGSDNFTFNVSSDLTNTALTLKITNHFTGQTTTKTDLTTDAVANTKKTFSLDLDDNLGLTNGPHDVELILEDGSNERPMRFFFIDIFPDQYDMWSWTDQWEYSSSDSANTNIEIYDVTNNWQQTNPSSVLFENLYDQFGTSISTPNLALSGNIATFNISSSWTTGNYHGELNVSVGGTSRLLPLDFFVRGNDNLQLFWSQDNWDYSSSEVFSLTVDARDGGSAVANVEASLSAFEKWPENWDQDPVDRMSDLNSAFNFTPENKTNSDGQVVFKIDLSGTSLETGGYTGRLNVGGQIVWFDFQIRTYQVEAYTAEWEYGISDTIEINVRGRDMNNWNPLSETGNVTIERISKFEPGNWQPEELNLSAFGIVEGQIFDVANGEALLEMQANSTVLNLTQPHEFEFKVRMNLSSSGSSEGWTWFRLSNADKASATIIDLSTSSEAENIFGDQTYQLQLSGVSDANATLTNLWGPGGEYFGYAFTSVNGTPSVNFTTPSFQGWYTLEIEIDRGGYYDYLYKDFEIGGGTEMNAFMDGNVIPGINFTVYVELFGSGDDPWCAQDPYCTQDWTWFGPLGNETINLTDIINLENFSSIGVPVGISAVTTQLSMMMGGPMSGGHEEGPGSMPGSATFKLSPTELGLEEGKNYDFVFTFIDNEGESNDARVFVQVEEFHVAISRKLFGLTPNTEQQVWLKTTYLNATPLSNCNITFDSVFDNENFQVVKTLGIDNTTDANGTLEFNYVTPTLSGLYVVSGEAECNVSGSWKTQELEFFIDVGSRSLLVDMDTKYGVSEPIKISIETKDRLGNPESKLLDIQLFHFKEGYTQPLYSEGGTDCQTIDANMDFEIMDDFDTFDPFGEGGMGGGGNMGFGNNFYQIETDENGLAEVTFCSMPIAEYSFNIYPIFMGGGGTEGAQGEFHEDMGDGFFMDFLVTEVDVSIDNNPTYMAGEEATLNMTIKDADENLINGTITFLAVELEEDFTGSEMILHETADGQSINVTNGLATYSFTIPTTVNVTDEDTNITTQVPTPISPVEIFLQFSDGTNTYPYFNMQFVITKSNESVLTAPSRIMSNSLIPISVETPADAHKKVQMGVFFLKDNSDKEKQWMIEGGVFFQNISGTASADFKILSPKEPGLYYLGMPISYLESEFKSLSDSYDILLHEIRVTLDMVNVTGRVVNLSGSGLAEVDVKIGNEDTETNASGYFTIEIPKGKKAVEIESDDGFMTSDKIQFNQNREVNVTFYPITIIGNLSKTFFNITSSTNIETETKLSITPIITNLGSENFTNAKLIGSAPSGQTLKYKNISNGASANSSFTQLYAGFKDSTNDLVLKLKVEPESWNSTGYFMVSGLGSVNSTLGVKIEREYTVETYAQPGDNIDNDNDGQSDEEQNNNQDDDNDGKIDEDLEATQTIEGGYCGDSVCQFDEMDYCFEDCEGGEDIIICGDGFCDSANGEDNFCFEDCGGNQTTCSPWTCEGLGQGQWCNEWGMITGDNFCDFCSWANPGFCGESCNEFNCWACSIDNSSGSNECQNTGCTFGSDQYGSWCYWQSTCSANDCWACGTQGDCSGTGSCAWTPDSWAPNGGWCEMPMDCTSNCAACGDQFSCTNSTATMVDEGNNTIGCTWESDNWGSWCEFNFSHGGFDDNEVKNFWLGLTNTTTDWEAVADYECYSGNCGNGITAGCYYVIVELGDADVNVSVNDTFLGFFAGDNYIQNYPTNSCFDFTNGSWTVSVEDIFEFETTNWTITIGSFDGNPPGPEDVNISVIITAPTNDQTLSVDYIELEYNVSGNLSASAYNHTQLYLNFHQNETNRTDTEGLKYYNFTNLADGNYELVVKLYNETDSILAGESVNVTINTSLPSSFDALVSILNPTNEEVFNENDIYIEYNVSGNTTNYENTTIEIISESFITRVDAVPGIFNYTFANVSDGDHTARVLLTSSMGQTTFDTVNLTINTSGGSGIDGKVNGSGALANVTIEIYNSTNQQLVANLTTDVNGNFNSPLATGTYFADITPPESYAYDVDIAVDNMVISEMETMDIMMPHIDGLPSLNSSPFSEFGLISWPNATAANFSMFVNNSNSYPINVTLILNASLLGDTVEYSNQQSYLTGGQFIELSYLFTPTIMGIGDLEFNLIVELNQSEVMSGSLSSSQLEVDIGMPIPLNIT